MVNKLANRKDRACLVVSVVVLLSTASIALTAQQQQPQRRAKTPPDTASTRESVLESELAKDNNDRVAASAAQIKTILIKDPGLMVELKHWMAKEATDNGQIVIDQDLTDNAIFDRLVRDVKFRSVATRLLQKYGYLQPLVNPESEMAREQDLLIQQRVHRIQQMEAQEDAAALRPPQERQENAGRKQYLCDPKYDEDCYPSGYPESQPAYSSPDDRDVPQWEYTPNAPGSQLPVVPSPRIIQTQGLPPGEELGSLSSGLSSNLAYLQYVSNPQQQLAGGGQKTFGNEVSERTGTDLIEQLRASAMRSSEMADIGLFAPDSDAISSMTSRLDTTSAMYPRVRRKPILARDRDTMTEVTVHRPNPYADIPSLYDLYVQAPSRDKPPQRFGADVFKDGLRDPRSVPMDLPVGPDYVVGPGDSLSISLWGGVSRKLTQVVDRQGRLNVPEAGPVLVSGHSLGDVQQAVQKAISTQYRDTSADVSVSKLRTVRVYVVGEVEEPGAYDISSLSTALNALVAAGGVTPKGSLRCLKHMRGRQELEEIDAYDLLLKGVTPDARKLENGDTLMVPPIGPQVTVTGMVRRPAEYEVNGERTVSEVLELAGGILPAAALRHVEVQRLEAHEKRTMLSLNLEPDKEDTSQLNSFKVQDGDEIHIFPIATYNQDTIYLQGHVLRPGRYSYREGMKLTDVVESYKDLLPEPAGHYAEIIRLNPPDFQPGVVSFDLSVALQDPAKAPQLRPLDTVRIFSRFDFEPAPIVSVVGEVRTPGTYRTSGQITLRDAVFLAGGLQPDAALESAQLFRINVDGTSSVFSVNLEEALKGAMADNIQLQPRDRLLIHKSSFRVEPGNVEITGPVAKPGRYPYTENMHAEDLILAAGGLKRSADTNTADLTRYAASGGSSERLEISLAAIRNGNPTEDVALKSGDLLAIRQVPGWNDIEAAVKVSGEVMHPSTYGIHPGERLSSVLERAGGYTKQAYPYGAVLTRREVQEVQERDQRELIDRLKAERMQLKALPEGNADEKNAKLSALAQTDTTLAQLSSNPPIGRVVIHIQSDVKSWKGMPSDIVLRDGDELVIPKKESVVTVTGQVFNPTAIAATNERSAKWYLSQAGGLTPIADKKGVFVIRADGSVIAAKNNTSSLFAGDPLSATLRPGDTVVVPEKAPKVGGTNWPVIMQTAQVLSSVALAVAYIHP
jgi:protein involved in polysaccharide export with SLBB domain